MPDFAGEGIGRLLVQDVVRDLTRRGVKAVEAFGDDAERPRAEAHGRTERGTPTCVLPAAFLRNVGFKTVAPHARWPRLRYEMQTGFNWKEDVEAAIAQLLGSVTISTAPAASPAARTGVLGVLTGLPARRGCLTPRRGGCSRAGGPRPR